MDLLLDLFVIITMLLCGGWFIYRAIYNFRAKKNLAFGLDIMLVFLNMISIVKWAC